VSKFLTVVVVGTLAFLVGCGGGSGTPKGVPTGGNGTNVQPIAVDGGPVPNQIYPDGAFTSVTLCNPGTTTCQTIDGILVDTGSVGLRVLSSAITLTGLQPLTSGSNTLYNCINFADTSFLWGTVSVADVQMAGEVASGATIQVVPDPATLGFTIPIDCSNGGVDESSQVNLGANGILGIGAEPEDCGPACDPNFDNGVPPNPSPYFLCSSTTCTPTSVLSFASGQSQQVLNPVVLFSTDNNGTIVQLPALPGQAATETGSLIFGIGTQANNQVPSSAKIFALDPSIGDTFTTTYKGQVLTGSFIDSGSNGLFFPDATIPACVDIPDFFCPASILSLSALNTETTSVTGATSTVNFSIDNADNLFAGGGGADAAYSTLGGPNTGGPFDFGLPFFYGRSVFTAIDGAAVPSNTPTAPWVAY